MEAMLEAIEATSSGQISTSDRQFQGLLPPPRAEVSHNGKKNGNSNGKGTYLCHLCDRTYERGDHLNRHLKTHENARPHKCTQCPKRFNRADLLNRHEASHGRAPTRRGDASDRVSIACLACVASKCKCQDAKPCIRCQKRGIPCEVGSNQVQATTDQLEDNLHDVGSNRANASQTQTRQSFSHISQTSRPSILLDQSVSTSQEYDNENQVKLFGGHQSVSTGSQYPMDNGVYGNEPLVPLGNPATFYNDGIQHYPLVSGDLQMLNPSLGFTPRDSYFGQQMDFSSWDFNTSDFDLQMGTEFEPIMSGQHTMVDPAISQAETSKNALKRHAAFERSPWLWNPTHKDHSLSDETALHVDEDSISVAITPNTPAASLEQFSSCCIDSNMRDQIMHLLFSSKHVRQSRMRSFPPLSLLNTVIRVYFFQSSMNSDHLMHSASFNSRIVLRHLVLSIISAGATSISTPAIWRFGLVCQELVRHTVAELWEEDNSLTRNLQAIQAFVIGLDVALWSGLKRHMELAESFCQPIIVMLRRMGAFTSGKDSLNPAPLVTDSDEVLKAKWERFIERESFKRLVLHIFLHDSQASIAFQKPPLISFTELQLGLPVSPDLWLAESAFQWRDVYLKKQEMTFPTFIEIIQNPEVLKQFIGHVDIKFCTMVILSGYSGQIWRLAEAKKFYPNSRAAYRLSLMTETDELYRDLVSTTTKVKSTCRNDPSIILLGELLLMISHVSPEDLHRFAGKYGALESKKASDDFRVWLQTANSRLAIWHAGQVLKSAKNLMPTQLKAFYSVAVYYASLTLWVYGTMLRFPDGDRMSGGMLNTPRSTESFNTSTRVTLNQEETVQVHTFRANGEGAPGLAMLNGQASEEFVALTATDSILNYGRWIYRNNFQLTEGPLPPLLESLGTLMEDLSSQPGSRASRPASEAPE